MDNIIKKIEKDYIDTLSRSLSDLEINLFFKLEKIAKDYNINFNIWDIWEWLRINKRNHTLNSSYIYIIVEYLVYRYSKETLPADDDVVISEVNDCYNNYDDDITYNLEYMVSLIKQYVNKYVDIKQFKNIKEARDYFIKTYTKMQQREVKKFERKLYKVIGGKKWER